MAKRLHSRSSAKEVPAANPDVRLLRLRGLPEIHRGDDLSEQIANAATKARMQFENGDVLVIAQKVISKAEGAVVKLGSIVPSPQAQAIAERQKKDPRLVEVILNESKRLVRTDPVLIAETRHGYVCANAGVDHSNIPGDDVVSLLPRDPDRSAKNLAAALRKRTGKRMAVIISDTFGRPWRLGLTNVAIGASGVPVLHDLRGTRDREGKPRRRRRLAHGQIRRLSRRRHSRLSLQARRRTRHQHHSPCLRGFVPLIFLEFFLESISLLCVLCVLCVKFPYSPNCLANAHRYPSRHA